MICSVLLLTSCHYKDLEYSDLLHNMRVVFHWDEAPDATPESMLMYVFAGEAQPVVIPFSDIHGGPAALAPASYQFIAMNDGTELLTRGTRFEEFEVYAPETSMPSVSRMFAANRAFPVAPGTENQHVYMEPEWLQTHGIESFSLTEKTETVEFMMHEAVKVYHFIIEDVENLEHVTAVTATLSGMSESWLAGYDRCTDTECLIPFTIELVGEGTASVAGEVRSFGHCPHTEIHNHFLTVYYEMDNGKKLYTVIDVTERLHDGEHDNGGDDPIVVEGPALPYSDDPDGGGGMFTPEVDEWIEINEDIYL